MKEGIQGGQKCKISKMSFVNFWTMSQSEKMLWPLKENGVKFSDRFVFTAFR